MRKTTITLPSFQLDYRFRLKVKRTSKQVVHPTAFIMPDEMDKFVPFGYLHYQPTNIKPTLIKLV